MSHCLVIFNPTAGPRRRRRLRATLAALRAKGVSVTMCETCAPGDAARMVRAATGCSMIVAAGGDGTINEVLKGLRALGDECALTIIPLGSSNVLARELGLDPNSPEKIAAAIAASLEVLVRYRARTYRVEIDGRDEEASSVVIANGHFYGGPYVVARDAALDDPHLHVCLFRRTGRWNALRYLWGLLSGRLDRFPDFEVIPASRPSAHLPVELSALAGSLRIARPAAAA
jgi:diacylglycerol kinase (ATP)